MMYGYGVTVATNERRQSAQRGMDARCWPDPKGDLPGRPFFPSRRPFRLAVTNGITGMKVPFPDTPPFPPLPFVPRAPFYLAVDEAPLMEASPIV